MNKLFKFLSLGHVTFHVSRFMLNYYHPLRVLPDPKFFSRIARRSRTYCLMRSPDTESDGNFPCGRCRLSRRDRCWPPPPWVRMELDTWCSDCCRPRRPRLPRSCQPRDSPRMQPRMSRVARPRTGQRAWCVCFGRLTENRAAVSCIACSPAAALAAPAT